MKLVVDGLIFQKDPHGGIARIYRETLPRLCDLDPGLTIHLFTDGPLRATLPTHAHLLERRLPAVRPTLRPRGLLRRVLYPLRRLMGSSWDRARHAWLADLSDGIWHSTFYSLPVQWRGPQVVMVYDMIPERFPALYNDPLDEIGRQRKRRCIIQADRVMCISQATSSLVKTWYGVPDDRLCVIYPAYSHTFCVMAEDDGRFPQEPTEPYLLYVGGRAGYKNFAALIDAYAGWAKREQILLVCVGAAWQPDETRLLEERGVVDRVRLLQGVDDERLRRLYNRAIGFVYPSLEEGFGIPLLEAMACGCPIAASRIPSTLEVAGDIPLTFDPTSVSELRSALDRLAESESLTARREVGLARVRGFSWEKTAKGMQEVYRSVSQARGAKS